MSSYMGPDAGDLTPSEMYQSQADGSTTTTHCRACQLPDGSPDAEQLGEIGTCLFGCGRTIQMPMGMCHACGDHSCNRVECDECGREYEDWNGTWEEIT